MPVYLWVALVLGLAVFLLYRLGILSTQAAWLSVGGCWGGISWWRGRYALLTGRLKRNFRLKPGQECLHIQVEVRSGELDLEVRDPQGGLCFAWYAVDGLDVRCDLTGLRQCAVSLSARSFKGEFLLSRSACSFVENSH